LQCEYVISVPYDSFRAASEPTLPPFNGPLSDAPSVISRFNETMTNAQQQNVRLRNGMTPQGRKDYVANLLKEQVRFSPVLHASFLLKYVDAASLIDCSIRRMNSNGDPPIPVDYFVYAE
jgi:hypothetical protein